MRPERTLPWRAALTLTLATAGAGGCAIGYHGRIGSADQQPHSVTAQFLYLGQVLAGVTVTSAGVRPDVDSVGRSESRYAIPVGVRVFDSNPGDNDDRWELWPVVSPLYDGGAPGFDAGLHLRYQRLGYLALGVERTFGEHADTQGFLGFGVDLGRMDNCGCLPW